MSSTRAVLGNGSSGLDVLVRHLWLPFLEGGEGRVIVGPSADEGWADLHSFAALPSAHHPRLLVSHGRRRSMARALTSYRGLRAGTAQAGRAMAGILAAATGLPLERSTVRVQFRSARSTLLEPVSYLEHLFGKALLAVVGVRHGANGKATLQLFDSGGSPEGYAKLGWSPLTDRYVRNEADVLSSRLSLGHGVQTPAVLAHGLIGTGTPFLLTRPLPESARTLNGADDLSRETLITMFPVVRHAQVGHTGQFKAVRQRLVSAHASAVRDRELLGEALKLARRIEDHQDQLPVVTRWHGDLVPWNCARDAAGTVWLWDWETSEVDAVAGLDLLHWFLNTKAAPAGKDEALGLQMALAFATNHLQSLGLGPRQRALVAATYALSKAERYWSLAAAHGTWSNNRIVRAGCLHLLATGRSLLA